MNEDLIEVEDVNSWRASPITKLLVDLIKERIQSVKNTYVSAIPGEIRQLQGRQMGYEDCLKVIDEELKRFVIDRD